MISKEVEIYYNWSNNISSGRYPVCRTSRLAEGVTHAVACFSAYHRDDKNFLEVYLGGNRATQQHVQEIATQLKKMVPVGDIL